MDDPTRVEWREWGPAAFEAAAAEDRPILLSLTATWCDHCHEMDAETYADPRIAANVNDRFVPVRVDVDRNPRVRDRYTMGGFPSTVFLASDGSLLTGAGYLGPDGMRQVLDSVRTMWTEEGADAGRIPRALAGEEPPAGELTDEIEGRMVTNLRRDYDEVAGGWGEGPKFPLPDAVEFALKREREMALRSLDAISANLLDEYEGGFYRFAEEPDWSGLHHEKLLDENAALVRAFANAYLHSGSDEYREPAARTVDYLTTTLWLPDAGSGAFAGSQAPGDAEDYTLDPSDREAGEEPPVDDAVYAGRNALAVEALCTYAAYTDDADARRYAERALETLREHLIEDGVVTHYRERDSFEDGDVREEGGVADSAAGEPDAAVAGGERALLVDQARVLGALTTARSVLGADVLADARAVADETIDRLREGDSFLDGPAAGPGLLSEPLRPLDGNVAMADGLLELSVLNGEQRSDERGYREVAEETLSAFAGASDRFGVQVARFASVASRLREEPLVIRVAPPVESDLYRAAHRMADHEKVVVPAGDGGERGDATAAELEPGTARVERGDRRSAVAGTPAELSDRVRDVLE